VPRFLTDRHFSVEVPLRYVVPERSAAPSPSLAVIAHIFYPDQAPEIAAYLGNIPFPADIFISTDTEDKATLIRQAFATWPGGTVEVIVVPNRGRDIAGKLVGHGAVHDDYEYVLHVHSKASPHHPLLQHWRGYLFETLLGSPDIVESIFELFARMPRLGFLAPQHWEPMLKAVGWSNNFETARDIARDAGFALNPDNALAFPSGSMFWARSAALKPLLDLKLQFASFPVESGQCDSTPAHAIERLFFAGAEAAGYTWFHIARPEFFHNRESIVSISRPRDLDILIRARGAWAPPTPELLRTLDRRGSGN
jgi:lipopolysaccharide biosynthesis protein